MAEISYPKMALGAWAWGNDGTFGSGIDVADLKPIFDAAMEAGLNLWDTAYAYGMGTSEKVLGGFLAGLDRGSYLVSDKLTPQCMDTSSTTPVKDMLDMQLSLMGLDRFDIYWVHNTAGAPDWTEKLAAFFEKVLPNYEKEKVYMSDIKKIVSWYNLLVEKGIITEESIKAYLEEKANAEKEAAEAEAKEEKAE